MRRLDSRSSDFDDQLDALTAWQEEYDQQVDATVQSVLRAVRERGDAAVLEFTARFDQLQADSVAALELSPQRLSQALDGIDSTTREALSSAADRVRSYHEKQRQDSWQYADEAGNVLGQKITPMSRAGIYVPGGKASYPSSVLMNALPAKVAG
ncbi:MAG: histidinol dehydrogenase, partial [Pseudomonadota bacterium]